MHFAWAWFCFFLLGKFFGVICLHIHPAATFAPASSGWQLPTMVLSETRGLWLFWVVPGGIRWPMRLRLARRDLERFQNGYTLQPSCQVVARWGSRRLECMVSGYSNSGIALNPPKILTLEPERSVAVGICVLLRFQPAHHTLKLLESSNGPRRTLLLSSRSSARWRPSCGPASAAPSPAANSSSAARDKTRETPRCRRRPKSPRP